MKRSSIASGIVGAVVMFAIVFSARSGAAQVFGPERWFTDRPSDVKEPPAGPAPRTADDHPDLSGVWWPGGDVAVTKLGVGESRAPSGPPRQDPNSPAMYASLYKPEAAAKAKPLGEKDDPALRCIPSVIGPHVSLVDQGYIGQIIQTPKFVVLLTETYHGFKIIPIDGRGHRDDVAPSYRGDSVGHWEGDTLVVDSTNFNGQNWLFDHGNVSFYSDALHVIERYRRIDANTLEIATTIEDPKMITQPWQVATHRLKLAPFDQIMEVLCTNVETASLLEAAAKDNYGRK
jgi:hypothetical protein